MKYSTRVIAVIIVILPFYDLYLIREFGQSIFTPLEWTLIVGSALSLFIRHKSAWLLGLLLMGIFVLKMAKERFFPIAQDDLEPMVRAAKFLGAMIGLFVIGTVGLLFRYPYLDRRQKWLGPTADRYIVQLPVTINGSIGAVTLDLSYTGAHIRLKMRAKISRKAIAFPCKSRKFQTWFVRRKSSPVKRIHYELISTTSRGLIRISCANGCSAKMFPRKTKTPVALSPILR